MAITSSQLLAEARAQVREIEIDEAKALSRNPDVTTLDVRDSKELISGMIEHAIHAHRGMLKFYLDRASESFLPALQDKKTLIMVCGSGGRAALAAKLAIDMGWDAVVLKGGMKAWRAANETIAFSVRDLA